MALEKQRCVKSRPKSSVCIPHDKSVNSYETGTIRVEPFNPEDGIIEDMEI